MFFLSENILLFNKTETQKSPKLFCFVFFARRLFSNVGGVCLFCVVFQCSMCAFILCCSPVRKFVFIACCSAVKKVCVYCALFPSVVGMCVFRAGI